MSQATQFQTAVSKAKAGDRTSARDILLRLVEENPNHELAWLWLSELVQEPEDKIIALENALTINPQRTQAKKRLAKLQRQFPAKRAAADLNFSVNGSISLPTAEEAKFAQINQLFASGNIDKGRQALAPFLQRYADNEAGWWLLIQHADSRDNLLNGLDHLLRINPHHQEAPEVLATIKPTKEESLQVARLYERLGQWDTAVRHYKRALKSPNNADRLLAKKHLPIAEEQRRLANIKETSTAATIVRLAAGPTLLYGMLILVQAGLNPLQVSPALCAGNLIFLAGLLLLGSLNHRPGHPRLDRIQETAVWQDKTLLRLVGYAFILLPILLLLLLTLNRLLAFELNLENLL